MKNKWSILFFICAIFVLYTIDRALLGILAAPIQQETGIDKLQFGVLSSAVFWTFPVCVPFAGMLGDRFNRAKLIGIAVCAWSVMAIVAGFASCFWSLLIFVSIAITVPQTMFGPSATALIAEHHKETRTTALSIYQGAFYTGWFLSGAAVAGVLKYLGTWRAAYFVFGGIGLALGIVFLILNMSKPKTESVHQEIPDKKSDKPKVKDSILAFFGCKTALLVATGYVVLTFIGCGYAAWGPMFIKEKFSLTVEQAGTGVMFYHYAAAFAGVLAAGFLTDHFIGRFPRCRMVISAIAFALMIPSMILFSTSGTLWVVWVSAACLGAMIGVVGANQFTVIFDVVPSRYRSGAVGFLNVIAGLVGSTAPIAIGALSNAKGVAGFEIGFASIAAIQFLAIVTLLVAMTTFKKDRITE